MSYHDDFDSLDIDWSLGQRPPRRSYGDHPYVQRFEDRRAVSLATRNMMGGLARLAFGPDFKIMPTTLSDVLNLSSEPQGKGWIDFGIAR